MVEDTDWKNRLAFIDGFMPLTDKIASTAITTKKQIRRKTTVPTTKNAVDTIINEITQELIEKEATYMAVRLFQRARELMGMEQDQATVTIVGQLLSTAAKYFDRQSKVKQVTGVQAILVDYWWRLGNEKQKEFAVKLALRKLRKRKFRQLTNAEIIKQFIRSAERQ